MSISAEKKINHRLSTLSTERLFDVVRQLNQRDDHYAHFVIDKALDVYASRVSEDQFIKDMALLDAEI